ncbi:SAM-dependent DNA methyltransferase, partial [Escherichia coli]|nr:SAM-dependent DNA methyltransferase [Escherichia coli]
MPHSWHPFFPVIFQFSPKGNTCSSPGHVFPVFTEKHMTTFIDHQKAFISLFNRTAPYHKRHKVFEDFVSCSVI